MTTKRLTVSERNELFEKQDGQCFYCGVDMHRCPEYPDDGNTDPAWFTVARDRLINQIVGACRACNNVQRHD